MTEIEKQLRILKDRVAECKFSISHHTNQIRVLDGEITGLQNALERLEPLIATQDKKP